MQKNLRNIITKIAGIWPEYYKRKYTDSEHLASILTTKEFPEILKSYNNTNKIKCEGSDGKGSITRGPWIASFHTDITECASEGYYLVYLFSVDLEKIVLGICLATTQFNNFYGQNNTSRNYIEKAAKEIARHIDNSFLEKSNTIKKGIVDLRVGPRDNLHKDYERSSIVYIEYNTSNLPEEDILKKDYLSMLEIYESIVNSDKIPHINDLLASTIPIEEILKKDINSFEVRSFTPRIMKEKNKVNKSYYKANNHKNKVIGDLGEHHVLCYEKSKLLNANLKNFSDNIVHEEASGNRPGWDITSFDLEGSKIFIEVKATVLKEINDLNITVNEWEAAKKHRGAYFLYLVTNIKSAGKAEIEIIQDPYQFVLENQFIIKPLSYKLKLCS